MCVIFWCREDKVSDGVQQKHTANKTSIYSGARSQGSGIRRHTVSSDTNTNVVGITCICLLTAYVLYVMYSYVDYDFFQVLLIQTCGA